VAEDYGGTTRTAPKSPVANELKIFVPTAGGENECVLGDEGTLLSNGKVADKLTTHASRGGGIGAQRSWSNPSTFPSGSVRVATRRPPPTSRTGSFTVAPAAVTSASFASMSGTCQ
jgi:hypothetical protein